MSIVTKPTICMTEPFRVFTPSSSSSSSPKSGRHGLHGPARVLSSAGSSCSCSYSRGIQVQSWPYRMLDIPQIAFKSQPASTAVA